MGCLNGVVISIERNRRAMEFRWDLFVVGGYHCCGMGIECKMLMLHSMLLHNVLRISVKRAIYGDMEKIQNRKIEIWQSGLD